LWFSSLLTLRKLSLEIRVSKADRPPVSTFSKVVEFSGIAATYGVIGMLDLCLDPSADARGGAGDAPLLVWGALGEFAAISLRNCSLFMLSNICDYCSGSAFGPWFLATVSLAMVGRWL
jgi:hypothetical protein